MIFSAEQTTRLLGAIEADALVFLCGAGLSKPEPSYLLSAVEVARICYDKWKPLEDLDPSLRENLDKLAGHFHAKGDFEKRFIPIVPWNELVGPPNRGHAAIADFLISRATHAVLSANCDSMIEQWAEAHKVALRGALTGHEAENNTDSNPLVKFHGCMRREREHTLWTRGQLGDAHIHDRVTSCSNWMNLRLPGKDLLVLGFWTDWGYLNEVLANAFTIDSARSVTVVDVVASDELKTRAPVLWEKLNALSDRFEHVRASGSEALEELRLGYSRVWAQRFYALSQPLANSAGVTFDPVSPFTPLGGEDLYNLRRDVEGLSYARAATQRVPAPSAAQAAYAYVALLSSGATFQGSWLQFRGHLIRIVNGAGRGLEDVKGTFVEPPTLSQPDFIVCAGAAELSVPPRIIAIGHGASTIRPGAGGTGKWITLDTLVNEVLV